MQPIDEIALPGLFAIAKQAVEREVFQTLGIEGFPELRRGHGCVFGTIGAEGDRLTSLAERANMTKQAVGEVVAELEGIGYVERVPDPTDGRAKIIRLTGRGEQALVTGRAILAEIQKRWEDQYGKERVDEMIDTLREIVAAENAAARREIRPAA